MHRKRKPATRRQRRRKLKSLAVASSVLVVGLGTLAPPLASAQVVEVCDTYVNPPDSYRVAGLTSIEAQVETDCHGIDMDFIDLHAQLYRYNPVAGKYDLQVDGIPWRVRNLDYAQVWVNTYCTSGTWKTYGDSIVSHAGLFAVASGWSHPSKFKC